MKTLILIVALLVSPVAFSAEDEIDRDLERLRRQIQSESPKFCTKTLGSDFMFCY